MQTEVILVDDHMLVRRGLRGLLDQSDQVRVIGEAAEGFEAIELVRANQPRVVVMDISMPRMNGLEATSRVVRENPSTRVLVLSMHADDDYVLQAFRHGASGYLHKDAPTAELIEAIEAIARGEFYLGSGISQELLKHCIRARNEGPGEGPTGEMYRLLTPRQREVLQLIAEGQSTRRMAETLGVGIKTIETHRAQLMKRLGIYEIAGLVRFAIRLKLVTSERQN
ncbi:MAG TPA: response regulator transcription factor [Candidatus Limnocylindrales bacterium]|nr:response regulator transcription factor [Candidatus Limnocylindrales bacterium]